MSSENQYILPNPNCEECNGSGYVDDEIDDGERRYHFTTLCECVTSQASAPDVIITVITPAPSMSQIEQNILVGMILDEPVYQCPEINTEEQAELWADIQREANADWLAKDREYFKKYT